MFRLLVCSLFGLSPFFGSPAARAAERPFAQVGSDLRPDPSLRFGTLPNGLRYVIMPNHEPKNRVSLRLLVLAGSFDETESQRGLAHYLEHMAFNGSTHYAPGTLVEKLQRLGMGFGADTNAATSFDHTIYELELPDAAPATLEEGLQILSDYGGGLLLQPAMIDKERGIILSEKRTRDSVAYRSLVARLQFIAAGTRVPERLPIGLTSVIEHSGREPFLSFYNTWYRPEDMVVVVVGDIDPTSIDRDIVSLFSALTPRSPEPVPTDLGHVEAFTGIRTRFHGESEAPYTHVVIESVVPFDRPLDTRAYLIEFVKRNLAVAMLNRRLALLSKEDGAPFIRASANIGQAFNLYRESSIEVICKADQWKAALGVADQERRQALKFGFRPDELKSAVADYRNDLLQAVKTAATRPSRDLADEIAESVVANDVYTSPQDDWALLGPFLDTVTPKACADAFRSAWSAPGTDVFVAGNAAIPGDAGAAIAAAYADSQAVPVKPTAPEAQDAWAYTNFGPAGRVVARSHIADLDITELTYSNGVRLNLKKTDFEANTIHVSARLGTGRLTEPAEREPGLGTFTDLTFSSGGLGRHSGDDLERILAGKTVESVLSTDDDAFDLEGDTTKDDFPLEFQLLAASLSDPGYRPEALRVARKRIDAAYRSFEHTERGPLLVDVARLCANGDPRFGLPTRDQMMELTLAEMKDWLTPQLASGALEVSVVGDFDPDAVIDAVSKTLGALPSRGPRPLLADRRNVTFPTRPFSRDYTIDTVIPKSLVAFYWPTEDNEDLGGVHKFSKAILSLFGNSRQDGSYIRRTRRLSLLADVLADRLRVRLREQMGSTYVPTAESMASEVFPGYGFISAAVEIDPARTAEVERAIADVAGDLNRRGVSPDELARAKNPELTAVRESERSNDYWISVLSKAQEEPEVLDWARSRRSDIEGITPSDLDALASAYLDPSRASRVLVHPAAAGPKPP